MAKSPTLNDIAANGFEAISTYNANQDAIETAFANTISRDGSTPNSMEANLDLNSYRIINLLDPVANQDAATKVYVDALALGTVDVSLVNGIKYVSNIAALKALTGTTGLVDGAVYCTAGYYTANDNGSGFFVYDASATNTANDGTIILPTAGVGRFFRIQDKVINVKEFGAKGDGTTNDTNAVKAAIAAASEHYLGRAEIYFPDGKYVINEALLFAPTSLVLGYLVRGAGPDATWLLFSGSADDGIRVSGAGVHFELRDMLVNGAPQDNVHIGYGNTSSIYTSYFNLRNLHISTAGRYNLNNTNCFMGNYESIWCALGGVNNYRFNGFHTTLNFTRCHSTDAGNAGWKLDAIANCQFNVCASDRDEYGFYVTNCTSSQFNSCGVESVEKSGFYFEASDAVAGSVFTISQNVKGTSLNNCHFYDGSTSSRGTYACIEISAANSRAVNLNLNNCMFVSGDSLEKKFKLTTATNGTITLTEDGTDVVNTFATDSITGTGHYRTNRNVIGKKCLLQTSGGGVSVSNGVNTTLTWNTSAPNINTLNATFNSNNGIIIPNGVNRIKIHANVVWDTNTTGTRRLFIERNFAAEAGMPYEVRDATIANISIGISSREIDVAAGDVIRLKVFQDSGATRTMATGPDNYYWFQVEATG